MGKSGCVAQLNSQHPSGIGDGSLLVGGDAVEVTHKASLAYLIQIKRVADHILFPWLVTSTLAVACFSVGWIVLALSA